MSKYAGKDAARETGSSGKQTGRAWHDARDSAAKEGDWGVPKNRHSSDEGFQGERAECFVATVAFGSCFEPQVQILREYRDSQLVKFANGRLLIRLYCRFGPTLARMSGSCNFFKKFSVRILEKFISYIQTNR